MEPINPLSFSSTDFPAAAQSCILSFLDTKELAIFSLTSKYFLSFCRHDERIWFFKCKRRWGPKTLISKWGAGKISYKSLYQKLDEYEKNIIGFFTKYDDLLLFEWGPFYITCWTILPEKNGGYGVVKKPFLWMTLTSNGEALNYLAPEGKFKLTENDLLQEDSEKLRQGLILVNVTVSPECDVELNVVENPSFFEFRRRVFVRGVDEYENVYKSPPDSLMSEIDACLADKAASTGKSPKEMKMEKEKPGMMRRWETEEYYKIECLSPTPNQPLQGLWKGICHDGSLEFYHASYSNDDGYFCTRIEHSFSTPVLYHPRQFTSFKAIFLEPPFSTQHDDIYKSRIHFDPSISDHVAVTGMFGIMSLPMLKVGILWRYANGNFGFSFEVNDHMIDLKPMLKDGKLLDEIK